MIRYFSLKFISISESHMIKSPSYNTDSLISPYSKKQFVSQSVSVNIVYFYFFKDEDFLNSTV